MTTGQTDAGAVVPSGTLLADHLVIDAMLCYGGGFAKALARAAQLADDDNLRRIKHGWPDYWQRYSDMANVALVDGGAEARLREDQHQEETR